MHLFYLFVTGINSTGSTLIVRYQQEGWVVFYIYNNNYSWISQSLNPNPIVELNHWLICWSSANKCNSNWMVDYVPISVYIQFHDPIE